MRNFLLLFAMLMFGASMAQNVKQSIGPNDDGTEFRPALSQYNSLQSDAMSIWALPSIGSTSGNTRCPGNTYRYQRTEYLITPAEMAASGFPTGYDVNSIGFLIGTAGVGTQSGAFTVYLRNTSDVTYTIGTNWDVTGFTTVSSIANWTVPIAAGSYEVPFSGGSAFTYTGGGVYVAWEFSNPSGALGTTALVALCNTNVANTLYGNRSNTAAPTALTVSSFRPATIFGNNFYTDIAAITNIYTQARNPVPFNAPTPISVRVANSSATAATFDVTVTVKDITNTFTRYTATQTVTALAGFGSTILTYPGWNPVNQEEVNITATTSVIPGENWLSNNTLTIPCNVNNNLYSYNYSIAGSGGFGYTYPGTGIFASKFTMNGTGKVTGANLVIGNSATNVGNSIYAVVMNSTGAIVGQSAPYLMTASDPGVNKNFTFPTPPSFTNEVFYVGLAQVAGTAQYYPMGTFPETPMRTGTFYTGNIDGTGLADLAGGSFNITYGIEAQVAPSFSIPTVTTLAAGSVLPTTATLNGSIMANSNTVAASFEYGLTTGYGTTVAAVPANATGLSVTPEAVNITGLAPATTYHFRAIGAIGLYRVNGADLTFTTPASPPVVVTVAATGVTSVAAVLNGTVNASNFSTTASFEYGPTAAYGSTATAVPPTVTGNTVTTISAALSGLVPNTLYHFRAKGVNAGGTVYGSDLTFTTVALAPVVTTVAATGITATAATLNGTVNANNASTVVTFQYGTTVAYGTTVTAAQSPVTGYVSTPVSAALTGLTANTTFHYRCVGVNATGTTYGADMVFVTVCPPAPSAAGTITGVSPICLGTTGVVYSVATIPNADSYHWTVPTGGTIVAGNNSNSITVDYTVSAVSGNVSVYGVNSCANGTASNFPVTFLSLPVPTITGANTVCENSSFHTYATEAGMSNYQWNMSPGAGTTWASVPNQFTVLWTAPGTQWVSVNYTGLNGCSAHAATVFNVTVNAMPVTAGAITGMASLCAGTTAVAYSIAPVPNAVSYAWTLPAGASIASGAGTRNITVDFSLAAVSGNITVQAVNDCGNGPASPPFAVTVSPLPAAAGTITGTSPVCQGSQGVTYTVPAVANATTYAWTVPTGATIATGATSNSITVNFSLTAATGPITVQALNSCGEGAVSSKTVTVNNKPPTPVVTQSGSLLTSSAATGNQWYWNGNIINGATAHTYTAVYNGTYSVKVTLSGCSSDMSNIITMVITGMDENGITQNLGIYPNPSHGHFTLTLTAASQEVFDLRIMNNLGMQVYSKKGLVVDGTLNEVIDLPKLSKGIYSVVLNSTERQLVRKFVVN